MTKVKDALIQIKELCTSANAKRVVKRVFSLDSSKIIVSIILLIIAFWLVDRILLVPALPTVYDEKITLRMTHTGTLQSWFAQYDLLESRRSFTLKIGNLSIEPSCLISFTISPSMPVQERNVEVTIVEIVPQVHLKTTLSTDTDYISLLLENDEFIQTITLQVSFNQPSLLEKNPLPYERVFYQTEVICDQDILLSQLTIGTPILLAIGEFEPSREVTSVRYQGYNRYTVIEPLRTDELVAIQLVREPSSLVPLALSFLSLLSVINLVYALHRSISNKEHRYVMLIIGFTSGLVLMIIMWLIFA